MFHLIVADSKSLRVLEFDGERERLDELAVFHNPDARAHERDLVADRPGRTASSASGARQAYEPKSSARRHALERWLKLVGSQLRTLLTGRRSEGVVLIGAPRMISLMRARLPARVEALPRVELSRDLAKLPIGELTRRVQPAIRELRRLHARTRPGMPRAGRPAAPASA